MKLAESVASAGAKMVRDYLAELRRQGKIRGNFYVVIKNGKKSARFPLRER